VATSHAHEVEFVVVDGVAVAAHATCRQARRGFLGRSVRYRADRVGARKLTLTVTDRYGRTATATKTVQVVR
jgi:hypothetical protein